MWGTSALTTLIEFGHQRKLKINVAFIYLSAAYDTVWRDNLLNKLAKIIPYKKTIYTLRDDTHESMLPSVFG